MAKTTSTALALILALAAPLMAQTTEEAPATEEAAPAADPANDLAMGQEAGATDGPGSNYTAATRTVSLPPGVKRYIRATAVGEANGGDASAGSFSVQLLF